MNFVVQNLFAGLQVSRPSKDRVVHVFDVDDTLTCKPDGFDNTGMTRDTFFDAARSFAPDASVLSLLRLLKAKGDAIAIATARPPERLQETMERLDKHNVPYDQVQHSSSSEPSGVVKQERLLRCQQDYQMVGTLFDDSPFNIEGARLQGIDAVHLRTNQSYWNAHPEYIYKVSL